MIRSAAALFAKKTAIVAISGVAVIGGAGLALADDEGFGTDPDLTAPAEGVMPVPSDDGDLGETPLSTDPAPDLARATGERRPDPGAGDGSAADTGTSETCVVPDDGSGEGSESTAGVEPTDGEAGIAEVPADEVVAAAETGDGCEEGDDGDEAVHPENHGRHVSEAAHGGGECADLTGRDKGQCVAGVARSDVGKPHAPAPELPAAETADDQVTPTPALAPAPAPADAEQQDSVASSAATAKPAPPAHANGGGNAGGKGGGKK